MSLPPHEPPGGIDGWVAAVADLPPDAAALLAAEAARLAREMAPKVTGRGAAGLLPASGEGWYGVWSRHEHMRHVNEGTRPRVMTQLAGKTIPMWITDRDGSMTSGIPLNQRASRTRTTLDGRQQVLIFRKAAPIGSTKRVMNRQGRVVTVPRAYPGARRRINGRFAGLHWRHPGLPGREFVHDALVLVADRASLEVTDLYPSRIGA